MLATFGFDVASVELHRRAGVGFCRCERETAEIRRLDDKRNERTQLLATFWQVKDIMACSLCTVRTFYSAV